MFPVINALQKLHQFNVKIAVTAQHREMLDQVLEVAGITPDIDLDLMRPGQSLDALAARILTSFGQVLDAEQPDRVLVHGDTLTTLMVAQACYFRKVPVGHVEAGLRSSDIYAPWPEEVNRKVVSAIADMHFAPTQTAAKALRDENIPDSCIFVTGNTVVDALLTTRKTLKSNPSLAPQIAELAKVHHSKQIIAVTAHRRENFGQGMHNIAAALKQLSEREDVAIIYPLHPNPQVAQAMRASLQDSLNISLIEPLDYPEFVALLELAHIALTDSGGVQEEAPSLGTPVLVMRDMTERPEGLDAGTAKLVGSDPTRIVRATSQLLDNPIVYAAMSKAHNPYGDGNAATRIAQIIADIG